MTFVVRYADGSGEAEVRDGEFILDALLRAGIAHPFSCRQGICTTCCVRLVTGEIREDPYEQCILSDAQLAAGYRLLCVGCAESDCVIELP